MFGRLRGLLSCAWQSGFAQASIAKGYDEMTTYARRLRGQPRSRAPESQADAGAFDQAPPLGRPRRRMPGSRAPKPCKGRERTILAGKATTPQLRDHSRGRPHALAINSLIYRRVILRLFQSFRISIVPRSTGWLPPAGMTPPERFGSTRTPSPQSIFPVRACADSRRHLSAGQAEDNRSAGRHHDAKCECSVLQRAGPS